MKRAILRVVASLAAALVLIAAVFIILGWEAFGQGSSGERQARITRSKQWAGSHFENPQPLRNDLWLSAVAFSDASPTVSPTGEVPTVRGGAERFQTPPPTGLRITWLGHSTTLIELDGMKLLTDPVFSERASPYSFVGPARWYPPLIPLKEFPKVDAVLVSHDHYDHLDEGTVKQLKGARFFVPLGIGAHLEYWGIPAADITELDWWEEGTLGPLRIASTPARHASGRQVLDQGATLWTSWTLVGPTHRVWYSGDTGLFPALRDIGEKYGPFDVALVEIGQYHRAWPDWHIGPEQAVRAATMVRAKTFFPIHWGLFTLALHAWTEPVERALAEARARAVPIITPKPGQSVEPDAPPPGETWRPAASGDATASQRAIDPDPAATTPRKWWPDVAWQTAREHPIVSTQME